MWLSPGISNTTRPQAGSSSFYIFRSCESAGGRDFAVLDHELLKLCSPGLQSGEAGFQTRENALSCNDRALALVRMLTSAAEIPLEETLQFIRGGFSHRAKREIDFAFEI